MTNVGQILTNNRTFDGLHESRITILNENSLQRLSCKIVNVNTASKVVDYGGK